MSHHYMGLYDHCKVHDDIEFEEGAIVAKEGGDYTFVGPVTSAFWKTSGKVRYVVEDDRGILHVFGPTNMRYATAEEANEYAARTGYSVHQLFEAEDVPVPEFRSSREPTDAAEPDAFERQTGIPRPFGFPLDSFGGLYAGGPVDMELVPPTQAEEADRVFTSKGMLPVPTQRHLDTAEELFGLTDAQFRAGLLRLMLVLGFDVTQVEFARERVGDVDVTIIRTKEL